MAQTTRSASFGPFYNTHGPTLAANASWWVHFTLLHHPWPALHTSVDPTAPRSTKTAQTTQNALFGPFSKFFFF